MASLPSAITVTVERAAHDALARCVQAIRDEFGVQVNSAHFKWVDASTVSESRASCALVSLDTQAVPRLTD